MILFDNFHELKKKLNSTTSLKITYKNLYSYYKKNIQISFFYVGQLLNDGITNTKIKRKINKL